MLPVFWRLDLRHLPDFFATCSTVSTAHLLLFYRSTETDQNSQWSVVIKKTLGGAVDRQKSRRRLRSAIVTVMQTTPPPCGLQLVVMARRLFSKQEYEKSLNEALHKMAF